MVHRKYSDIISHADKKLPYGYHKRFCWSNVIFTFVYYQGLSCHRNSKPRKISTYHPKIILKHNMVVLTQPT